MGHVGDIGGRGRGRWSGESTRVGPAPTRDGPRSGETSQEYETVDWGSSPEEGAEPGPRRGRTGERPAMPGRSRTTTGTRPVYAEERNPTTPSTGSRPALPNDRPSRTTTGTRPAVPDPRPAATFADSATMEQGTRPSTRAETLVMPKVELPEPPPMTRGGKPTRELPATRGGRTPTPAETSTQAPEGRTVTQMDTPIGRGGGTRVTRMPEAPGGKGQTDEAGETPDIGGKDKGEKGGRETRTGRGRTRAPEVPAEKDGFRTPPQTATRPALGQGPVRGPLLPVKELIPGGLEKLPDQEGVAKRFASDAALLHQQLRPSALPSSDRALRLWAFFTAYAEAAAAHDKTPKAASSSTRPSMSRASPSCAMRTPERTG